jgi:phosphatidylinositol glycan class W
MTSLKEQKEAFVSGHEGTSPWEILLIISTIPIGLQFYQAVTRTLYRRNCRDWELVMVEAISFGIPMILCQSNLLYPWGVGYLMIQLALGCVQANQSPGSTNLERSDEGQAPVDFRAILTIYRASLMFLTFIAILAVDFHVFPRRLVKTETQGYSLMDVGAASFVYAAGLVSAKSRGRTQKLLKTMHRMVPLLIMGMIRLLTHKGLDYQEHVSEYGVHWNFFFTLAMLSPTAALFPGPSWTLPLALLTVYQAALSLGLQEWVVEAPRTCRDSNQFCTLFVANREGVLGCIGYGALYLASEWIGYVCLWRPGKSTNFGPLLIGLCSCWFLLTTLMNIPVSRRTTNAPFVVWILLINTLQLVSIHWAAGSNCQVPKLLHAVNENGLVMFVIANLLTGLTNLSIDTLGVTDKWALTILFAYVHIVGAIAYGLNFISQALKQSQASNKKEV